MATVALNRRPFAPRNITHQVPAAASPINPAKALFAKTTTKRPRSPDVHDTAPKSRISKRSKCVSVALEQDRSEQERKEHERKMKDGRRGEREAQREEFRTKYTQAFPYWTFYFDTDCEKERLTSRVEQLNARVAKFFSNEVTHVITNQSIPTIDVDSNKENLPKGKATVLGAPSLLKSPIKLKGRTMDEGCPAGYAGLVKKAIQLDMKIWDPAKLDSILNRCLVPEMTGTPLAKPNTRSLTSLLESERRHGATSERDPTQKRHDYYYFHKNTYFMLVEDMRQELATIAAMEYPILRTSDGREKGDWPVLHCHPLSRGPFLEYNEKEERRRDRQDKMEKERERERALEIKKLKLRQLQRRPNLRKSVSMNNLLRQDVQDLTCDGYGVDETDFGASANVSGYLASTGTGNYVAASGNSVGITSTYGTTSTAGAGSSRRGQQSQFPAMLRGRLQNQVLTSRRVSALDKEKASASSTMMPPPIKIPEKRPNALLRKSKSTNTLRLPKRDEGSKPGYCESCRTRFDDFKEHVKGKKHRKFASNDGNFLQLDYVLNRVRRRTIAEVEEEEACYKRTADSEEPESSEAASFRFCGNDDELMYP